MPCHQPRRKRLQLQARSSDSPAHDHLGRIPPSQQLDSKHHYSERLPKPGANRIEHISLTIAFKTHLLSLPPSQRWISIPFQTSSPNNEMRQTLISNTCSYLSKTSGERKLWHQLTDSLAEYFRHEQSAPQRLPIYKSFILTFAEKINHLKLVALGLSAATQCRGSSIRFLLKNLANKRLQITRND